MNHNYISQQKELVKKLEDTFAHSVHKPTIVAMQKDYANDTQICLTSVVFIPDNISSNIIFNVSNNLKKIEPHHYYYSLESMHLTVKNIRTIHNPPLFTEADINKANHLLNEIVPKFPIFEFNVEDVLPLPTSLSIMAYSNDTLQKLILALDNGLRKIGMPDNKQYLSDSIFWGNITICRFTQNPGTQFINEVKKMRNLLIGEFRVEKVSLITCNAVCHPKSRRIIGEYELRKE